MVVIRMFTHHSQCNPARPSNLRVNVVEPSPSRFGRAYFPVPRYPASLRGPNFSFHIQHALSDVFLQESVKESDLIVGKEYSDYKKRVTSRLIPYIW